jgi:hypothetical protein
MSTWMALGDMIGAALEALSVLPSGRARRDRSRMGRMQTVAAILVWAVLLGAVAVVSQIAFP